MTPRSQRNRSANHLDTPASRIGWSLLLALLLPRLVRMLYPQVWVEDDFYLESAWLISAGARPYLDFVHPHMPLLEWFAGAYIKLFGTSHLSIELLNQAAIFVTSILTYVFAIRVTDRSGAAACSLLYSYSSLLFRYHMYERESFVAPLIVLGALVALDDDLPELRQGIMVAAVFFLACAIKLTAAISLVTVLVYLVVARRRISGAIASSAIFAAALGGLSAILYWRYGNEFIFQTFIFHFMKGRDSILETALYPLRIFDLLVPLSILGWARIVADRLFNRGVAIVLAMVSAQYAFYGVLSPTAWGHNYLEATPFIAILAGLGLVWFAAAVRRLITTDARRRGEWVIAVGGGGLIVLCLCYLSPLVNENWLHGSVYGFGFIDRAEVDRLAEGLRRASTPADEVIAPSFLCFEAGRRELIRFPETYGVYREAKAEYERTGFDAARRKLGRADFFQLIADTAHIWTDQMRDAIARGKVPAVINDSRIQMFPLVYIPDDFMIEHGYRPVLTTEHFRLWQRQGAS